MNKNGVTLIELLAAVVIVAFVVSSMALFIPKASKAAIAGRYLTTAKNLANSKLQQIKQDPYPNIAVTATGFFAALGPPVANCDCKAVPAASLPIDILLNGTGTFTENAVTYTRQYCVNLVQLTAGFPSLCPVAIPLNDTGLKNIRVRVFWTAPGGIPQSIEIENVVTR